MPLRPTLLLALLCSLSLATTAQAQTASSVCLPLKQARLISTSLRKYEALKPLTHQLILAKDSLVKANGNLHRIIVLQDTSYFALSRTVHYKDVLLTDQATKAQAWKLKAKSRWWLNIGLTALLLGVSALAITK